MTVRLDPLVLPAEDGFSAAIQEGLGIQLAEDLDQAGDDTGPSRLVARTEAGAVVAMEVFVEQQMVAPMGIVLEFVGSPVHRTAAGFVAQKDSGQPIGNFPRDLEQV